MEDWDFDSFEDFQRQLRIRYRGYLVMMTIIGLLIGAVIGYGTYLDADSRQPELTPPPHRGDVCVVPADYTPWPTVTPSPLRVYVSGAVLTPQVVIVPPGSLVKDALRAAGGAADNADLDTLNLAAPLADHQHVAVPTRAIPNTPQAASTVSTHTVGGLIAINEATAEELTTLPNIGPVLAQRIVDYRTEHGAFQTCRELLNVSGIGVAKYHDIEPYITVTLAGGIP